jgi:hypothetical protein
MKPAELTEALIGRLEAEGCRDLGDSELTRCLVECVCGHTLIPFAQQLRDAGTLIMRDGSVVLASNQ